MNNFIFSIAFTIFSLTIVQAKQINPVDSLSNKNYQYFEEKVIEFRTDSIKAQQFAKYWLKKANEEKNLIQQVKAYKALIHFVDKKYRMIYADSLLEKAIATKNNDILGSAYLTIGAAHYDNNEYTKALDLYILANNYIAKTNDQYLIHKVKYTIALTKYFLGYYDEAIALLNQCMDYFKEENDLGYLKSMHVIALCYTQIERYDHSSYFNKLGMELSSEYEMEDMIPYFKNAEGINLFKQKDYENAIKLLKESKPQFEKVNDYATLITTQFYLGKCYWEISEKNTAVTYFTKVHDGIQTQKYSRPDLREGYEMLIEYFGETNELKKELFFIKKLMEFDKEINQEFKYLSYKIHKEYDTKTLLEKKRKIENELASNRKIYFLVVTLLIIILLGLNGWHLKSKKREKEKFNQIMAELAEKKKSAVISTNSQNTNLSPELTKSLLKNLEKFEKQKKFLEKDMNLAKLAALLDTNTKYASLIIAEQREKKTTTYINDLKIDYIVELLISNNKFRNYTNKALSDEAGFGSTQIFTLCFKNKIGMSPTSFIQQLKSSNQTQQNKLE
ncbi:AraC family transcriptional regulator [Flavobacterium sp.]|uniref:AraC family transcriptional regulator n=1 Tax=Flavobacterium sp. TaxID=239 RepID=UPI00261D2BB8|nr:AraC family transcriptional regulator [Flavobacterium sp.]MDD3005730.1 AraC family transcriptional regulator [Flavobacterium sp.]